MTDTLHGNGEEELFRSLETVHQEPAVAEVFADMAAYNELLANEPVDSAHINAIMNELDERWYPLINMQARFTGLAGFSDEDLASSETVTLSYYEEELVIFRGVQPVEDLSRSNAFSVDEDVPRYYQLLIGMVRTGIRDDGTEHAIEGVARIEDIAALEMMQAISFERAKHVLDHFEHELLEDIDIALRAPATHEGELAVRLNDLYYDPTDRDEATSHQIVLALNRYTRELLQFDSELKGYDVQVRGAVWDVSNIEAPETKAHWQRRTLMTVEDVLWILSPENGDDTIVPHLVVKPVGDELGEIGELMFVPLSSVERCEPLRYQYYQNP